MKERLIQLFDMEQLTPSKFADLIGVQRSSVSHVISGRNNPSFDFIQKTLTAFPGLHADWLILGKGTMYDQMGRSMAGNLFSAPDEAVFPPNPDDIPSQTQEIDQQLNAESLQSEADSTGLEAESFENQLDEEIDAVMKSAIDKKVVQVMIFYDDDTFKSFDPS